MHVLPHHFQCRLYRNQAIIFWQLYKYFKEQVRILITIYIFGCSGKSLSSFMYLGIWLQKNQLIQTLNKSPPLQNSFIFVAFKLKSSRTLCKMLVNQHHHEMQLVVLKISNKERHLHEQYIPNNRRVKYTYYRRWASCHTS